MLSEDDFVYLFLSFEWSAGGVSDINRNLLIIHIQLSPLPGFLTVLKQHPRKAL
ncbi:hypothetical protein Lepto7375DRAFT_6103 [Leptolyngbya sp. PCC 7375]|nr:hypothetical protein Lepto7375DRAFT_6103 [Leptolyngbya sp. PCC 7375]